MAVDQPLQANLHKDFRGSFPITPFPLYVDNAHLVGADRSYTAPAGTSYVVITATADCWAKIGAAAVAGAADIVDGTGSVLIKGGATRGFGITAAKVLHLIGTAEAALEWFSA